MRKPRKRRDAEQARQDILDAAEKRMVKVGPAGIRLQQVAKDAGMSHPTVLHHFGSREALVKAVVTRCLHSLHKSLIESIQASTGEEEQLAAMIEGVHRALSEEGYARVILWLALAGQRVDAVDVRLSDVVDATHALRTSRKQGKAAIPREDTAHSVVLAALTLIALPVMGPILLDNAGLGGDAKASARFRAWLAHALTRHLDSEE